MADIDIQAKERSEIEFWRDSPAERPEADSVESFIHKMSEARVLLEELQYHHIYFTRASSILELGAGQGWASCLVKKLFPGSRVLASDISSYAIASAGKWEEIFKVKLDGTFHCRSYEIPLSEGEVDLVFCFQSAHHFVRHRRTLREVYRVLRSGGICLYLFEPSCRAFLHKAAHARVNRKRPEVPEDVLIYSKILKLGREAGFRSEVRFNPTLTNRGPKELLYYYLLEKLPPLRHLLPCSADFLFFK